MTTRCPKCNLLHFDDDTDRCANAQRLAIVLANAGAIWHGECTYAFHAAIKQSEHAFLLNTRRWSEFDDGYDVIMRAACRRCGGELAMFIRKSDARLAAAVEVLKEGV